VKTYLMRHAYYPQGQRHLYDVVEVLRKDLSIGIVEGRIVWGTDGILSPDILYNFSLHKNNVLVEAESFEELQGMYLEYFL